MRVLRARLYERALEEQQAELAADRRAQVGTGDRAEKIRTYNYGERRVTDHRIKLTEHNLEQVLEGALEPFTSALTDDERRRRLEGAAGGHVAAGGGPLAGSSQAAPSS
jgi:peptide chain release factor 1